MFKELFDSYNVRARLSVYVILITPVVTSFYVLYAPMRSIGASTMLLIVLAAFSNYFLILLRHFAKHHYFSETAAQFLRPTDGHIDSITKARYYSILSSFNAAFGSMTQDTADNDVKATCNDIITWLKNKTRDNHLIQEENTLYGFINNLYNLKLIGLMVTILSMIIQIIILRPKLCGITTILLESHPSKFLVIMDFAFLLFWTIGVSLRICKSAAEKYAYALLGSIDSLTKRK